MMTTKFGGKILIYLLCLCAVNSRVFAAMDDSNGEENPYSAIWARNDFDLKPALSDGAESGPTNLAPPNVQLTGMTTILGRKQALFLVQQSPSSGKSSDKKQSYILSEGEHGGGLEILEINLKAATVKVRNNGVLCIIALETNRPPSIPPPVQTTTGNTGIPRTRAIALPQQKILGAGSMPGFTSNPQTTVPNETAPQPQYDDAPAAVPGFYGQPFGAGGFQINPAQPAPGNNSTPPAENVPVQTPPVSTSPAASGNTPGSSSVAPPQVPPEIAAEIAAAEEAARGGQLQPPSLPPGVTAAAIAAARAGAPPPPNFPTPPPLPSSLMNSFK